MHSHTGPSSDLHWDSGDQQRVATAVSLQVRLPSHRHPRGPHQGNSPTSRRHTRGVRRSDSSLAASMSEKANSNKRFAKNLSSQWFLTENQLTGNMSFGALSSNFHNKSCQRSAGQLQTNTNLNLWDKNPS